MRGVAPWRQSVVASIVMLALLLGVWIVVSRLVFVVPPPWAVLDGLQENLAREDYGRNLVATGQGIAVGLLAGFPAGVVVGVILGRVTLLRKAVEPTLLGAWAVPKIVLYPALLPILSIGLASKVFMAGIHAFFPVVIIVSGAVQSLRPVYFKLGTSLDMSLARRLLHIVLPGIRRPLLTALRLAVSVATIGVIVAEFFATELGVGRVLSADYEVGAYDRMWATVLLLFILSFAISMSLWRLERRVH